MSSYAQIFSDGQAFQELPKNAGRDQANRHRIVHEERRRVMAQGYAPAFVYNLHPFSLRMQLGDLGVFECPAAKGDTPGRLEIRDFRFSMADHGDADYRPIPVFPREIAKEFLREFAGLGGVVVIDGEDRQPAKEEIAAAGKARLEWVRRQVALAADSWSRFRQHKLIDDRQREAVRELFARGDIPQLPDWASASSGADMKACPECAEMIRAAAVKCRFCGWREADAPESVVSDGQDQTRSRKRK
ncbi:MAG: zinc ribbon domain-containing protein [Terriglobales bacterium]